MEEGMRTDFSYAAIMREIWMRTEDVAIKEGKWYRTPWFGWGSMRKNFKAVKTYRCIKCGYLESYA